MFAAVCCEAIVPYNNPVLRSDCLLIVGGEDPVKVTGHTCNYALFACPFHCRSFAAILSVTTVSGTTSTILSIWEGLTSVITMPLRSKSMKR